MAGGSPDVLSVLQHVVVVIPLEYHQHVKIVCRKALMVFRSKELYARRACFGWGPEIHIFHTASRQTVVRQFMRWLSVFPQYCSENAMVHMCQAGRSIFDTTPRQIGFAQIRVGGSLVQPPALCSSDAMDEFFSSMPFWNGRFPRWKHTMTNLSIERLDPQTAPSRIQDAWWSVARSVMDGTQLPASLTVLSLFAMYEDGCLDPSAYGSLDLQCGVAHNLTHNWLVQVIWNGESTSLLVCEHVDFSPFPYCNIKVWGNVNDAWIRDVLIAQIKERIAEGPTLATIPEAFRQSTSNDVPCMWQESWTFAENTDWSTYLYYNVSTRESLYDLVGDGGCDFLGEHFWFSSERQYLNCPFCQSDESPEHKGQTKTCRDDSAGHHSPDPAHEDHQVSLIIDDAQKIQDALNESVQSAEHDEQALLVDAIMRSKLDAPLTADGVVVMRMKRVGYIKGIVTTLLQSKHLSEAVSRVVDAGCEVRPDWTPALLLVPCTQEQLVESGLDLSVHHILAHERDKDKIIAALKELPSKQRTSIVAPPSAASSAPTQVYDAAPEDSSPQIEVQYTFVHFRIPKDISEASQCAASAPSGLLGSRQPTNPRRWD